MTKQTPGISPHPNRRASNTAADWVRWWETWERAAQPVSDRLVQLGGVAAGQTVLDVASGLGEPAFTAARRVGRQGRVVATDRDPTMLDEAAKRAQEEGLSNTRFQVMDAAAPDLEIAFDAILCRWGFMFVPDLDGALRQLLALLKRAGRLATATWGAPEEVPVIQISASAITQLVPETDASVSSPPSFRLSDPAIMLSAMKRAGFTDLSSEELQIAFEFASAEEYTRFRRDMTTLDADLAQRNPPELIGAAWQAVTEAARGHADQEGRIRLRNTVLCFTGARS
jgi:enediyne biosynthesis protein CalE5